MMESFDEISLLSGMFPAGVVASVLGVEDFSLDTLMPEEMALVARASPRRRREFAAGRFCARTLLAQLGAAPSAILVGPHRAPLWPSGFTGSISHASGLCVAAIAKTCDVRSVGIDLEPDEPLDGELASALCTPEERRWLAKSADPERWLHVLFSIKEAVYKCQFPLTHELLDFKDVQLDIDASGTFCATAYPAYAATVGRIRGRWRKVAGWLVCAATIV